MPATPENTAIAPAAQTLSASRSALRQQLKQARARQSATAMQQASQRIRQHLAAGLAALRQRQREAGQAPARRLAAFWPLPQEPDIAPLLAQWAKSGAWEIALPVVVPATSDTGGAAAPPLRFLRWRPETAMRTGAHQIQEPWGSEPAAPPDVVLVPTLGFARQHGRIERLGYGQGHYDRTLAHWQRSGQRLISVGVAWACGEMAAQGGETPSARSDFLTYQTAQHDVPLDALVTEHGLVYPQNK